MNEVSEAVLRQMEHMQTVDPSVVYLLEEVVENKQYHGGDYLSQYTFSHTTWTSYDKAKVEADRRILLICTPEEIASSDGWDYYDRIEVGRGVWKISRQNLDTSLEWIPSW